jgi:predicted PurR-regulated permease PerM
MIFVPFLGQFNKLIDSIPVWIDTLSKGIDSFGISYSFIDSTSMNNMIMDWVERLTSVNNFEGLASTVGGVFSWTSLIFAAIVFSIYLVIDHDNILDFGLIRITSDEKRMKVKKLVLDLEGKLGRWLLGQAIVSSIAGIVLGSALALFNVPFALPMGVLIALLSTIPTLGATFGSIPPLLVALVVNGPLTAFIILLIFVVYQQIENNFIIPRVMGNAVGIRPILILFAAITFLILFGVWGAVLAVPAIVIGRIFYEFYIDLQKSQAKGSI